MPPMEIAKLRSTHNNYLTLPVIFLMLSTHYPLAFASEHNWLICIGVFDGGHDPVLFQYASCADGQPDLDMAGYCTVFMHHVAVDRAHGQTTGRARWVIRKKQIFAAVEGFEHVEEIVVGQLLNVPCPRACVAKASAMRPTMCFWKAARISPRKPRPFTYILVSATPCRRPMSLGWNRASMDCEMVSQRNGRNAPRLAVR